MSPEGIPDQAIRQLVAGMMVCCLTPLHLAVSIWICFVIQNALKRVPAQFRKIDHAMPWLRLVAFVPAAGALALLILNFFILPPTSKSIAAAAAARGDKGSGDGGARMAWLTCWLDVVAAIAAFIGAWLILFAAIAGSPNGNLFLALEQGGFESVSPALLLAGLGAMCAASLACLVSLVVFCFWLKRIHASSKKLAATSSAAWID